MNGYLYIIVSSFQFATAILYIQCNLRIMDNWDISVVPCIEDPNYV